MLMVVMAASAGVAITTQGNDGDHNNTYNKEAARQVKRSPSVSAAPTR
jgi:hypothetical protein